MKPTSKIIQIENCPHDKAIYFIALCEDGSIWERRYENGEWKLVCGTKHHQGNDMGWNIEYYEPPKS